jgi:AcrR family transcriptional regulator
MVDRAPLNRDRIAGAALDLIDAEGMSGLSMRKLGAQLGVEAMSLYHYVRNKDDLLDAVLDRLYSEIDLPSVEAEDWERTIRAGVRSFRAVLQRHPAALELFATRPARSRESFSVLFWAYGRFRSYGLDLADANAALHLLVSFVMGHVWSQHGPLAPVEAAEGADDLGLELSDEESRFVAHCREVPADDLFETGLDTVVAGLRARFGLP